MFWKLSKKFLYKIVIIMVAISIIFILYVTIDNVTIDNNSLTNKNITVSFKEEKYDFTLLPNFFYFRGNIKELGILNEDHILKIYENSFLVYKKKLNLNSEKLYFKCVYLMKQKDDSGKRLAVVGNNIILAPIFSNTISDNYVHEFLKLLLKAFKISKYTLDSSKLDNNYIKIQIKEKDPYHISISILEITSALSKLEWVKFAEPELEYIEINWKLNQFFKLETNKSNAKHK